MSARLQQLPVHASGTHGPRLQVATCAARRGAPRLAGWAGHGNPHDERALRRAVRPARGAGGRPARAPRGRPSLALVAGESGVGKSRLADELTGARARPARACSGATASSSARASCPTRRCWARCGRSCASATPRSSAPAEPARRPRFAPARARRRLARGRSRAEQARVFEGLLALLDALGGRAPLLLVIEDLHWADSSTRWFLSFLARTLCGERMLVVGTYRSDELHRRHPLRPLLAELARDPLAHMIELPRSRARRWASSSRASSAAAPIPGWSSASTRAARATRSSPRRSSRPGSTAAARCRRRCATR